MKYVLLTPPQREVPLFITASGIRARPASTLPFPVNNGGGTADARKRIPLAGSKHSRALPTRRPTPRRPPRRLPVPAARPDTRPRVPCIGVGVSVGATTHHGVRVPARPGRAPTRVVGLMDSARHVIERIVNTRLLREIKKCLDGRYQSPAFLETVAQLNEGIL